LAHSQVPTFFKWGAFRPFEPSGAVSFFFVLSGFVLSINAEKYRSWTQFFIARVARIWPAHAASVAFLFAIFWPYSIIYWQDPDEFHYLWINLALLQDWAPSFPIYGSLNSVSWSISVEMFFYAVFPLVLLLMLVNATVRVSVLTLMIVLIQVVFWKIFPETDAVWVGHFNPIVNLPIFAIGVAAGEWFKRTRKVPITRHGTVVQISVFVAMAVGNIFFRMTDFTWLPKPLEIFAMTSAATPFYALFILALVRFDGMLSRWLSRWLEFPLIIYLGEISYSLYLFHQPVIRWHADHLQTFANIPVWLQYLGIWTVSLIMSSVCFWLVERPGRKAIISVGLMTRSGCGRVVALFVPYKSQRIIVVPPSGTIVPAIASINAESFTSVLAGVISSGGFNPTKENVAQAQHEDYDSELGHYDRNVIARAEELRR